MYEESAGFDQNSLHEGGGLVQAEDGFSQTHIPNCNNNNQSFSMEEQSNYPQNQMSQQDVAFSALEMELQHHLNLEMEQCYNNTSSGNHEIQEIVHDSNWQEMTNFNGENQYHHQHQPPADYVQNGHHHHHQQNFTTGSLPETPYPTTPDLLNMFPLPRCSPSSLLPNSSITFSNSAHKSPGFLASLGLLGEINTSADGSSASAGAVVYDPLLPLNLPPQPPLLRELFHSLPHGGYTLGAPRNGTLFGGVDERDVNVGLYQNGDHGRSFDHNGVFEFTAGEIDCIGKNRDGKDTKHFATERHRRVLLNDKYQALRKLVPNPTKNDRASIVGDAIDYINELKRTVTELKGWVEKKRCIKERLKRPKTEDDAVMEGNESKSVGEMDNPYNSSSLRSSWLHRKSKNTEVDVRIIDDEVTVKLVQQKRINCLLFVSKVLDELQLDLHHVAGGLIGDYYSFLFNSKICEGSIVYASAVANKLIEVVDKQYAAIPPTSSY
ncbi:transcription factor bHLH91-like [Sesamum indicum]|uniref:Transcription factor bHLH91-like n=1 Tax=Sesamum indicum TaxID=4182 RepID=A0A6I9UGU3_SESIN|nr:transcription factor bHLH91-like [Sesamum indicum]